MKTLTIKIEKLKSGTQIGYIATVIELNNSIIMGDSVEEILKVLPDVYQSCEQNNISIKLKKLISA